MAISFINSVFKRRINYLSPVNYLAHALLSNQNSDLLVGNFIADHLRGNDFSAYSPGIIEGIYLHRKIDAFTDAHPLFKCTKRLFYNGFEKHSGVLVDIYFDHLLARGFERYHHQSLAVFSKNAYEVYDRHRHLLPETSAGFLNYVIRNNVYSSYARPEGIERVLFHLSQRIKHGVQLDASMQLFIEHEEEIERNFSVFFGEALRLFKEPG